MAQSRGDRESQRCGSATTFLRVRSSAWRSRWPCCSACPLHHDHKYHRHRRRRHHHILTPQTKTPSCTVVLTVVKDLALRERRRRRRLRRIRFAPSYARRSYFRSDPRRSSARVRRSGCQPHYDGQIVSTHSTKKGKRLVTCRNIDHLHIFAIVLFLTISHSNTTSAFHGIKILHHSA